MPARLAWRPSGIYYPQPEDPKKIIPVQDKGVRHEPTARKKRENQRAGIMVMAAGPRAVGNRALWLGAALALLLAGSALSASHWVKAFRAKSEIPQAVYLPIQSKNPRNLGLGTLLVASRDLGDPNFAETVILLVHYDAESVVGLILNRRTDIPLSRVLEGFNAAKGRSDPVYLGGPVEGSVVFALLQSPAKLEGGERIFGGVYLIFRKTLLEQTLSARPDPGVFRVYLGYAGWTSDQLRREVGLGGWFIFPADAATVFDAHPDSLWSRMILKTEQKFAWNEPAAMASSSSTTTATRLETAADPD